MRSITIVVAVATDVIIIKGCRLSVRAIVDYVVVLFVGCFVLNFVEVSWNVAL